MDTQPDLHEQAESHSVQPQLIFATGLSGASLYRMLVDAHVLNHLVAQNYGLALAIVDLNEDQVNTIRLLNDHDVYLVAWLLQSPEEGFFFNLQNYPQAVERYREFHSWALHNHLHFDAVALDIQPPSGEMIPFHQWGGRNILRRLWLAHENVLYPAACISYSDLLVEIRHDGYETHVFQSPLMVDDRRAGTTLLQRALDVLDLPADVEVVMCSSELPFAFMGNDMRDSMIASYGPDADSIGIGYDRMNVAPSSSLLHTSALSWQTIERDLLLAAHYTDTIYLFSFETFLDYGLLQRIATLDWQRETCVPVKRRVTVELFRFLLFIILLLARHSRFLISWFGWVLVIILLVRRSARRRKTNSQ